MANRLTSEQLGHRWRAFTGHELKDEVYHFVFELLDPRCKGETAGEIATEVSNYFEAQINAKP